MTSWIGWAVRGTGDTLSGLGAPRNGGGARRLPTEDDPAFDAPPDLFPRVGARDHILQVLVADQVAPQHRQLEVRRGPPGEAGVDLGVAGHGLRGAAHVVHEPVDPAEGGVSLEAEREV